ncbi:MULTISPECIES: HlyD family secretion protein [unclassified Sphingobacterium]|uniref:HlyD family secretion protein n=1 Tax=unclassified Sphingobacterium TaxID=2609468 RepID=UPI001044DDA2|nr:MULTISPECIES: secretion protein HlyD [unclassified Sphingobacterium]MCS3556078.1 HlyD family secretion protein [Sphingobacterium sp. JUb21]TCR08455.1 HlyD family secretion protein [Sphingobacterium sp. JUb20]
MAKNKFMDEDIHSEDLQEIISKPPSWLLKRGITFIVLTIFMIFGLAFFIRYPEVVPVSMKFNTSSAPKVLTCKVNGNLVKILVKDGMAVDKNTDIAYVESVADHKQVLNLLDKMKHVRSSTIELVDLRDIVTPTELELGELQNSYQNFYLAYLNYVAINKEGIYQKRKNFIHNEVKYINEQNQRIQQSFDLQKRELALAEEEYAKYQILAEKKVISQLELQQKEALLLAKRQSIPQTENTIINNQSSRLSKDKEMSEINNQMFEEEKKFYQSLNTFISDAENWKKQYVISSPSKGTLIYGDFLQENQLIKMGEELFYVNANKDDYYGEILIPQSKSSKIKVGQEVLIKVQSYPYQEYGYLRGSIRYISDIPIRDSVFFSKVSLSRNEKDSIIKLKPGILADAEIITEDQSIIKRIWLNLTKSLKF